MAKFLDQKSDKYLKIKTFFRGRKLIFDSKRRRDGYWSFFRIHIKMYDLKIWFSKGVIAHKNLLAISSHEMLHAHFKIRIFISELFGLKQEHFYLKIKYL